MKIIHLSDLHLGKRWNEYSMLEDQEYILKQILKITDEEKPQAVIIAGDIYDKAVPSAEAVQLFDSFLISLAQRRLQVFIISGNHDSAERLAFGNKLMDSSGIHIAPVYNGRPEPYFLEDEYGRAAFYLLPFIKPAHVRRFYSDEDTESYNSAMQTALSHISPDEKNRNILVTHQFVTGAALSESEDISVGGTDNIDASVFDAFDYVALGHIHGPQKIGRETLRYCGTPLKYSFSEKNHVKSVTVVNMKEKGNTEISTRPLKPLHDLRELRGSYDEITYKPAYEGTALDDYMHIILTDEEDVPNALGRLRNIYPNLMKLDYENSRTRSSVSFKAAEDMKKKTETELFKEFFLMQNGREMSEEEKAFSSALFEKVKEGER